MRNKIEKGTIADVYDYYCELKENNRKLTWDKFAIEANKKFGTDFGESAYRKQIAKYQGELVRKPPLPKETLLRADIRNQYQVEIKNNLNREYKELRQEFLRNEDIKLLIDKMISPTKTFNELPNHINKKTSVLCLSDLQETGDNYSLACYNYVFHKMKPYIEQNKITELYVIENGDFIDGELRPQDLNLNNGGVVIQFNNYAQSLSMLLEELSKLVKIKFSIINSNHTELRLHGIKAGTFKKDDMTLLLLNYLKAYHRNNQNIEWLNKTNDPNELQYNIIEINGYNFFQTHGDMRFIKQNNPTMTFDKINRYFSYDIDYVILGHRHNFNVHHISTNNIKGGDKQVIWLPALDPRMNKLNEMNLALSSTPAWIIFDVVENEGITNINKFNIPKSLWK